MRCVIHSFKFIMIGMKKQKAKMREMVALCLALYAAFY